MLDDGMGLILKSLENRDRQHQIIIKELKNIIQEKDREISRLNEELRGIKNEK